MYLICVSEVSSLKFLKKKIKILIANFSPKKKYLLLICSQKKKKKKLMINK